MKLREVYRYELEYRFKSPATWFYAAFLLLLAMWLFAGTAEGPAFANTPQHVALASGLAGTLGLLVVAALFGDAAVRDFQSGMDPLLYASPLRKIDYLGGRFLAALSVNALAILAIPIGVFACSLLMGAFDADALGPFRMMAYVQAILLVLLPNLILGGAILYATGVLTRHIVPVYLVAIGFLIACVAAMNALENTQNPAVLVLTDPLGLSTIRNITRYWTEAELNSRLVGFRVELLMNRAVWLSVAAIVFALLHWRFKFAHAGDSGRKFGIKRVRAANGNPVATTVRREKQSDRFGPVDVPRVPGVFGKGTAARQTFAIARNSIEEVCGTRWFVVVLLACTGLTMLWGWNVGSTVFDTSTWPVTFLLTETVLSERVNPIIYALIALFAGELVWKDRNANVDEIADAAPVSEGSAFAGRFLALVAMIAMFVSAMMIGGLLIQALQGYYHFEIGLYIRTLFGVNMATYLIFAVFAMTIQVFVHHKYIGHLVILLAFLGQLALRMTGVVQHRLLLYNIDPGWTYSDMNGFGPFMKAVIWFKLYWAAWAFMLAVVTALFWVRGREPGVRKRITSARERLASGSMLKAVATAAVLIVMLGGFVFYNTNILNEYHSSNARGAARAEYEKRYGQFRNTPQPTITNADVRFEIYPEQTAVDASGSFRLVNQSGKIVDSVHVMFAEPQLRMRSLSFDRAAKAVVSDEKAQFWIYALDRALQPGDSLQFKFEVSFKPLGFTNDRSQKDIVANGTSFNRTMMPIIGYQPVFELSDTKARRSFGLEPQPQTPTVGDAHALERRESVRDADRVQVHTIIGTAPNQTAITPGVLKRQWTENGRPHFEYETLAPTSFGALVVSAEYAVVNDRWHDVALQIFHHPGHDRNLDRAVKSMKVSLDYYTEQFGPYHDNQLRIVEKPRYGGFGAAHPSVITFTEDFFLSRVNEGEVDQPFYGTAHEIAHAWWGGSVRGASVRGHSFITESAANYSAMMVTEKTYGLAAARKVYDFQMEKYLTGRAGQSNEVPVLDVDDQPYIAYRKGALALYTLREQIGDTAVNRALRKFQDTYANSGPPYPTSRDLYAELKVVTPDSLHAMLADWFETVTLWDVRTEKAVAEKLASGEYRVTMNVVARKLRADSVGAETEVPMNDLVEIGIFAAGKDGAPQSVYRERHRIKSGKQTIQVTVNAVPLRAGIDPNSKLIDRDRSDNIVNVEAPKPVSATITRH